MSTKKMRNRLQRSQAGFGLVEIIIALGLGIVIMLGVTQIATNNSSTRYEIDRSGRQIENAAYALREMENDLTNAGFWGEMGTQDAVPFFPLVCPTESCDPEAHPLLDDNTCALNRAMGFPVQGGSAAFACDTLGTITPKANSDYVTVRRANSCALGSDGCGTVAGSVYLQVNSCFDPNNPIDPIPYGLDSDLAELDYTARDCVTPSPQYRLLNRTYYINDEDQLVRVELVGGQYEESALVDGVEFMKLEYGMDRNGDGQVDEDVNGFTPDPTSDQSVSPPTADAFPDSVWSDVVMVRISLVLRNTEPSTGFVDDKVYQVAGADYEVPAEFKDHRRQVYSRTVSLRNVVGRRE